MAIMGFPKYRVTGGSIFFRDKDITGLSVDERARMGIGMSFQRPPVVRGVTTRDMVSACLKDEGDGDTVVKLADKADLNDFLERDINYGFSGGEIKRSELLQLIAQGPKLALLDEPESGVDLEDIALIGKAINKLLEKNIENLHDKELSPVQVKKKRQSSGLIISHTGHILKYVDADFGYVLLNGKLDCVGNPREILRCISEIGYEDCVKCLT